MKRKRVHDWKTVQRGDLFQIRNEKVNYARDVSVDDLGRAVIIGFNGDVMIETKKQKLMVVSRNLTYELIRAGVLRSELSRAEVRYPTYESEPPVVLIALRGFLCEVCMYFFEGKVVLQVSSPYMVTPSSGIGAMQYNPDSEELIHLSGSPYFLTSIEDGNCPTDANMKVLTDIAKWIHTNKDEILNPTPKEST